MPQPSFKLSFVIRDTAEGGDDMSFRSNYSGRSMYGAKCVGVDCANMAQMQALIGEIITQLTDQAFDAARDAETDAELEAAEELHGEVQVAIRDLMSFKTDSMGRGMIVYWPGIEHQVEDYEDEGP